MGRYMTRKYEITAKLVALSPLSIGADSADGVTSLSLQRDGQGRIIIPGTALTGVLLRAVGQSSEWGSQEHASTVLVDDAVADGEPRVEVRDSVGINRHTGSAADGFLFSREIVPAGTTLTCGLAVESTASDGSNDGLALVSAVKHVLGEGIEVGAKTSSGFGRLRLAEDSTAFTVEQRDFTRQETFLSWVTTGRHDDSTVDVEAIPPSQGRQEIIVRVPWQPTGLMLSSVQVLGAMSAMPLTSGAGDEHRPVIPGPSLKGAFRSQAERIVRTMGGYGTSVDFADHMLERLPVVSLLFGHAPKATEGGKKSESITDTGNKGALSFCETSFRGTSPDCDVSSLPDIIAGPALPGHDAGQGPEEDRTERKRAERLELNKKLAPTAWLVNDHVAIDRWTGGADDSKLFAVVAPYGSGAKGGWSDLELTLNVSALLQNGKALHEADGHSGPFNEERCVRAALACLLFVIRDFCDGDIPLGYGRTRGYGEVTAQFDDVTITTRGSRAAEFVGGATSGARVVAVQGDCLVDAWLHELGVGVA